MISFDFTVRIEDRKFRFSADLLSERIAILGRSGAGKSTLAKALAGLLKPESGYIKFGKRILFDSSTGVGIRTTQINQKVISYSDQIDTFVGTFDVFDLEDSPLINILAERFWIVF